MINLRKLIFWRKKEKVCAAQLALDVDNLAKELERDKDKVLDDKEKLEEYLSAFQKVKQDHENLDCTAEEIARTNRVYLKPGNLIEEIIAKLNRTKAGLQGKGSKIHLTAAAQELAMDITIMAFYHYEMCPYKDKYEMPEKNKSFRRYVAEMHKLGKISRSDYETFRRGMKAN